MKDRNSEIRFKVKDIIENAGAEVVDFRIFYSGGKYILRCIVDISCGGITLDECAAINRKITVYLDESNCLGDNYTVEVNSPGIDRKLKTSKDFFRVKGRTVSVWLNEPVESKEYLEGEVLIVDDDKISLKHKGKIIEIGFNKVKVGKAKIEAK